MGRSSRAFAVRRHRNITLVDVVTKRGLLAASGVANMAPLEGS